MRGLFAGALALIALEVAVSTPAAAGRVGGLLGGAAALVRHLLDPTVPLIPDHSGDGPTGEPSSYVSPTAAGLDPNGPTPRLPNAAPTRPPVLSA